MPNLPFVECTEEGKETQSHKLTYSQLYQLLNHFCDFNLADIIKSWGPTYNYCAFPDGWFIQFHSPTTNRPDWGISFGYKENNQWNPERKFEWDFSCSEDSEKSTWIGKWEVHCSWFIVGELFQEYPDLEKRLYPFRLYSPRYFVTWNRPTSLFGNINTDVTEEEEQDFIYKTCVELDAIDDIEELLVRLGVKDIEIEEFQTPEKENNNVPSFVLDGGDMYQRSPTGYLSHWTKRFHSAHFMYLWLFGKLWPMHEYFRLEHFQYSGSDISQIPDNLQKITEPITILLRDNQITTLPNWISTSPITFNVTGNPLQSLPTGLSQKYHTFDLHGISNSTSNAIQLYSKEDTYEEDSWFLILFKHTLGSFHHDRTEFEGDFSGQYWTIKLKGFCDAQIPETHMDVRSLNYCSYQITSIPTSIEKLKNIENLLLSNNQITDVPKELLQLSNLKVLDLSGNPLSANCKSWLKEHFPNVAYFDDHSEEVQARIAKVQQLLSSEDIETVRQGMSLLDSIIETYEDARLYLGFSQYISTQEELKKYFSKWHFGTSIYYWLAAKLDTLSNHNFDSLKRFSEYNDENLFLFDNVCDFQQLTSISIPLNHEIPRSLQQLTTLTNLYLSDVDVVPEVVYALTSLKELTINGEFTSLGSNISNLTNLNKVSFGGKLTSLPKEFTHLTGITNIKVESNELTELPEELGNLTKLEYLNCGFNKLTSLPESLNNCKQLGDTHLLKNPLQSLPTQIRAIHISPDKLHELKDYIAVNKSLQRLESAWNTLSSLPLEIFQATSLKTLSIWRSQVTSLPPEIGQLKQLDFLEAYQCQVTELPPEIGQCTMLSSITFSGSKLTRIPKELANCTRLETLQISNNPITSIPTELTQLTNLEILDIYGTQIPEEEVQKLVQLFPEGVVTWE